MFVKFGGRQKRHLEVKGLHKVFWVLILLGSDWKKYQVLKGWKDNYIRPALAKVPGAQVCTSIQQFLPYFCVVFVLPSFICQIQSTYLCLSIV